MKNLQNATEMICQLKGSLAAMDALVTALLHAAISGHTIDAFEHDVQRVSALISAG